jgi:integrase
MARELTAQGIKRLPIPEPPDTLRDYPDGRVPGLCLRVFASGRRGWYVKYRQDGRQRRYKLGDFPTLGLSEARKNAEQMRVEVRHGADPVRTRRERKDALTLGGLFEEYLEYAAGVLAPTTMGERERILRGDDLRELRQLLPAEVTPRDVAEALDRIERRGAPVMLNRTQGALSTAFRWAVQRQRAGLIANPVKQLERRFPENGRDRWLDADEIGALWRDIKCRTIGAPTALQLVLVTAQRPGEVAGLRWSQIGGSTWKMPKGYRKAKQISPPHDTHLSNLARDILSATREYHRDQKTPGHRTFVFPNPKAPEGHIKAKALAHAAQRANRVLAKDGTIEGRWTPHDLRRTAATHMTKMGADRLVVEKVLGHKDYTVAGIYDRHAYWAERVNALDAWAEHLRKIVEVGDE